MDPIFMVIWLFYQKCSVSIFPDGLAINPSLLPLVRKIFAKEGQAIGPSSTARDYCIKKPFCQIERRKTEKERKEGLQFYSKPSFKRFKLLPYT
jgi:hypothetical protein